MCIYLKISSLLLKKTTSEFLRPAASAEPLIVHRSVFICFFNLLDGSPHSKPPSVIVWEDSRGVNDIFVEELIITGSRVMVHVSYLDSPQTGVRVWDWKTGDLVRMLYLEQLHLLTLPP